MRIDYVIGRLIVDWGDLYYQHNQVVLEFTKKIQISEEHFNLVYLGSSRIVI